MSGIQSWLNDLTLMPGIEASTWQAFRHTHAATCHQSAELDDTLAALGPVTGWLVEPSAVRELREETIALRQRPLSGEFFRAESNGAGEFWQIAHHPGQGWILDRHTLQPCPAADASCLGEPTHQLHAHRNGTRLAYWRLWTPDAAGAPACTIALLCDIQEPNR